MTLDKSRQKSYIELTLIRVCWKTPIGVKLNITATPQGSIKGQKEHHQKLAFLVECKILLKEYGIDFDEKELE